MSKVSLSLEDTKFKLVERSRGRMKIQIKFSKEEAEGFKNFCKLKPPEVTEEVFFKQIFFAGCNAMSEQISALVEAHKAAKKAEENKEEKTDEQEEEQLQKD
tara:strand:+ start:3072 stop:3377 length:306 start_codon:yes stop_codon:yes gene_type:complete